MDGSTIKWGQGCEVRARVIRECGGKRGHRPVCSGPIL